MKKILIAILLSFASCKSIFRQKYVEPSCELVSVENETPVDSSSFFQVHYKSFAKSAEPGIMWYSRGNGSARIAVFQVTNADIFGSVVSESGHKQSISFFGEEKQIYDRLLSDIKYLNVVQDCKESLPTHVTVTDVYIKDKISINFTYYSFHSPFKLGQTSRMNLGNAYKLMELTYYKMHNPNSVKK
ncbi:hypothetical protein ACFSC6_17545 [Rufibacter sediminis]|uniref:Uncharacterized protein n=1 Tax=Rufibacter sediminis TaxID=2762756 RepID=A0ABR6VQX1_9BACT|nr:hypothetical protein [Rufibacter sediminis]MBC3539325.1 hypothetical protein [Rufibacter sediminis]